MICLGCWKIAVSCLKNARYVHDASSYRRGQSSEGAHDRSMTALVKPQFYASPQWNACEGESDKDRGAPRCLVIKHSEVEK